MPSSDPLGIAFPRGVWGGVVSGSDPSGVAGSFLRGLLFGFGRGGVFCAFVTSPGGLVVGALRFRSPHLIWSEDGGQK